MRRQCAWCGRSLDDGPVEQDPDATVSHGICAACLARMNGGAGSSIPEFLDSLEEPVLLLDADHTVGMINRAALQLLGERPETALGERSGTIFDCENAHLPGGCGNTIHCSGCAIRRAVAHTHLTGESQVDVPATLRVVDDASLADVELRISTMRVGDRVLLRIDDYER